MGTLVKKTLNISGAFLGLDLNTERKILSSQFVR
jgi:hypothetical protein